MKLIKKYIVALALLSCTIGFTQQLPQFTQYMYNTISINPAYAGSRETLSVVGLHRSQWVGFKGGPTTQTLSINTPLKNEKVGVGISFINDKLGYEEFSYLYADFSYTINTGEKTKLAFGLKGGFTQYSLNNELRGHESTIHDGSIYGVEDRWNPNIGVGVFWHTQKWYIGVSAPRVLTTNYNDKNNSSGIQYEALERISYYVTGGYVFNLSDNTKFKPAALIKATNGAPLSYDLTANFLFNEKLWLGASYRINNYTSALGALVDFQVSKEIRIGYTYEYPMSDINSYTGGTHEVLLMFEVFKIKRIKSPRYF
ncbi:type IX secretion system membrane protein PorP/SprF [Oceanihabitans sediminis]|uniref:Type IX secretion system membrane protein PorP/SprF n=1 Tax=Oceanihabitans sediminis TaxID=1812012 RepID=A0A368P3L3_9FLAO|nr:type IX secretion system membrane protein PorP/SprF [Oceanihabitans sediminis]MDX1277730.1 type IX secretion system membrane protein PorP/SprF [Oceanihabitans sediminis]MDX1774420.1 type IX secretion system membrane protein PorP/SprF [Oceanihabitans sediminis]RBP27706.1 type IX secretion system PorP/SprF family membrane protein [Oceanihabitans sediminis]RCU56495.1 type IX secretion system membrane protein PorP/SprF [Oceanihabitans sediminis]